MAEKVTAGPITSANGVREAVCIHTKKIFSSCKDKDCIEDLTFYPTATAQSVIDASQSIRGGRGCVYAPENARVYNIAGIETGRSNLAPGLYMVVSGGNAKKVVVK